MLLDKSIIEQHYIEDCEVCCNPIQISVRIREEDISDFQAVSIEQ